MANEINMYATVQKDQMGLDKAVETVKHRMSRYSVTVRASPFALILSQPFQHGTLPGVLRGMEFSHSMPLANGLLQP